MSYSTLSSILVILPGMPQTTTASGYSATSAVITPHITRADNIINGKIAGRYDVKNFATSVPPMLQTISEDLATYFSFRSLFSADNQNRNEWTDKFQEAMTLLDEIRDSKIDLVDSTGNVISEREATTTDGLVDSNTISMQSFFDVDEPTDWKFDDDMLDTVGGNR